MLRQVVTKGALAAASANNISLSQTPVSGTPLLINGSTAAGGVATLDQQRRVRVTYGNEGSARTIALTGTSGTGQTIQETVAIPAGAGGTVDTIQDFLTVTRMLPAGGGFTTNVTVGTNTVGSSPWQKVSEHITPVEDTINCVATGTINYTVEITNDDLEPPLTTTSAGAPYGPLGPIPPIVTPFPATPSLLTVINANATGKIAQPFSAWRVTVNSGTGSVTATGIQGGIIQGH